MKKTGKKTRKVLSSGVNIFNEAGKYAYATAEYTGLVTFSLVKKGGNAVKGPLSKIVAPVKKGNFKKILPVIKGAETEKLRSLEDKLLHLEERLALLERLGIVMPGQAVSGKKLSTLNKGKLDLLREIVEANKLLRQAT